MGRLFPGTGWKVTAQSKCSELTNKISLTCGTGGYLKRMTGGRDRRVDSGMSLQAQGSVVIHRWVQGVQIIGPVQPGGTYSKVVGRAIVRDGWPRAYSCGASPEVDRCLHLGRNKALCRRVALDRSGSILTCDPPTSMLPWFHACHRIVSSSV